MGWQPIETAPKTTDNVLVFVPAMLPGEPDMYGRDESYPAYITISSYEDLPDRRGFNHRNGPYRATHWMPLPEHPEA